MNSAVGAKAKTLDARLRGHDENRKVPRSFVTPAKAEAQCLSNARGSGPKHVACSKDTHR